MQLVGIKFTYKETVPLICKSSFLQNINIVLANKLQKHYACHTDSISLGTKDVSFTCYITVDNKLAMCCISSVSQLCNDHKGDRSSGEGKEGDECDHKLVLSVTEAHANYETLTCTALA